MIPRPIRLLLLAGAAVLALAAPAQADRTAELGFEDGAIALNPKFASEAPGVMGLWRNALGVDWVRIQVYWSDVSPVPLSTVPPPGFNVADPNSPGYNWADPDRAVANAAAQGLKIMLTIHQYGPVWASTEPGKQIPGWKPNPALFAQFASAVARRYGNVVNRYLVGNEPNERVFLTPQTECLPVGRRSVCQRVAPAIYRNLVNAAYPAIKSTDPGAQVIIGELAPIGAIGPTAGNLAPLAFIRSMYCLDDKYKRIRTGLCRGYRKPRGDGFGYHPYQVREKPTQPQRNPNLAKLGDLKRLFGVLDRAAKPTRYKLYMTEYGYETNPPDAKNGVSPAKQAKYLQQAAYIAWSTPRVKLITQYQWRDDPPLPTGEIQGFQTGLLFNDNQPKPSLAFFANPFFIDTSKGRKRAVIWGQVRPDGVSGVRVLRQVGGGAFAPFLTLGTDSRGYFSSRRSLQRNTNYRFEYQRGGQTISSDVVHVG